MRDPEQEQRRERIVRLATRGRSAGPEFERDVRRAASEVAAHISAGLRVGLRTDALAIGAAEGERQRAILLSHLASVAPDPARGIA